MKFDATVIQPPLREVRHFRVINVQGVVGFEIEALDQWPDEALGWFERNDAIFHHHGRYFIILKDIPKQLIEEIKQTNYVVIDEKHQRRLADSLSPFGMMPQGTARIYEVPLFHPEQSTHFRDLFSQAIDVIKRPSDPLSLSGIFSS